VSTRVGGVDHDLSVVAIVSDVDALAVMRRALAGSGDRLSVATDLAEGSLLISAQAPDIAFIDPTLAGGLLPRLGEIYSMAPDLSIFLLIPRDRAAPPVRLSGLGHSGTLGLPFTETEFLSVLSGPRARLVERRLLVLLERSSAASERQVAIIEQVAEIAESSSRREAARRLAAVFVSGVGVVSAAIYVPAAEGSRQLMRVAELGGTADSPSFCDEMELLNHARERGLQTLRMALRSEQSGLVLLGKTADGSEAVSVFPLLSLIVLQATTSLALIAAREQSHRGAMKDPRSRAYTFAYFVDVAGRAIEIARRHERRFSVLTIRVEFESAQSSETEPSELVTDLVFSALRDTDVLARVDANEFCLLLPETNGLGAHACRQRVSTELSGRSVDGLRISLGVATFPHDGGELSRLLRVAKHRAEASRESVVEQLGLRQRCLSEIADALLERLVASPTYVARGLDAPRYIELPAMDWVGLALSVVAEAARAGHAQIVASVHAGISLGGAVRAEHGRDEGLIFDVVDVTALEGCRNLDLLCVLAEHATYLLLGRTEGAIVRAVHASDPLLVDLVLRKLSVASRLGVS
jgi:hypothetical protein